MKTQIDLVNQIIALLISNPRKNFKKILKLIEQDKYLIGAAICASIWVIYKFGYEMGNVSYKLYADLSPLF